MSNNGFLLVATRKYVYYQTAIYCAETLKDYYPEANITLFTHEDWVDERCQQVIDNIITKDVFPHPRTKLWALSKSPYDITMYLDADVEICHEDISTVFDTLESDDIKMVKIRPYCAAAASFPGGEMIHHCGIFLYKKNKIIYDFFDKWFEYYDKQIKNPWDLDEKLYPSKLLSPWDTFTFWRLLNLENYKDKLKIGFWKDDARWNFHGFKEEELNGNPVIIYHNSIRKFDHEKNKSEK